MRHHVAPMHCRHIFSVVVEQLGRDRPEIAPLAEFIKITRKAYSYAKLLKLRVVNKDRLFTIDNLKKSIKNLQDVMFLLDQAYKRMAQFCQNLPPLFEQSNLSDFVDFMLEYFEVQTGQHNSFTDVLYSLLDEACEVLNLKQTGNVIQGDVLQASNNDEGWISKGEIPGGGSGRSHFTVMIGLVSLNMAQVCLCLPHSICVLRKPVFPVPQVTVRRSMPRSLDSYSTASQLVRILEQLLGPRTQQTPTDFLQTNFLQTNSMQTNSMQINSLQTNSMQITRLNTLTRCSRTKGWKISLRSCPVGPLLAIFPEIYRTIPELSLQI